MKRADMKTRRQILRYRHEFDVLQIQIAEVGLRPPFARRAGSILYKAHLEFGALSRVMIELKGEKLQARVNSAARAKKLQCRLKDILGNLVSEPVMVHQTVEQAHGGAQYEPRAH